MESIWTKTCEIERRSSLNKNRTAEVAVIGAGMAGILTAYYLKMAGMDPIILEADRIAGGQTCKTTAKLTAEQDCLYTKLFDKSGREKVALYAAAQREALEAYRTLITQAQIDCDFEECSAYYYSLYHASSMRRNAEIAASLGFQASFTETCKLPFKIAGAVKFEGQAQFHPLKFVKALADELTIYENTPVKRVDGHTLFTDHVTVKANQIVFAGHYPFVNLPGFYFARLHQERSYVLALENAEFEEAASADAALGSDDFFKGMYLGADDGYSFRRWKNCLLLGGGGHRTGKHAGGESYAELRRRAKEWFPNSREVAHWSAQDCMSVDDLPYIGRYAASKPYWYVATGFRKWGMTGSMIAARLLSEQIVLGYSENGKVRVSVGNTYAKNGCESALAPYAALFVPSRFAIGDLAGIAKEGGQSAKGLLKSVFNIPKDSTDAIPVGHGGIVRYNGHKAGVYKDESGRIYAVQPKCPHLGCQLEWNPDEKSWDCPCHGSRFDYTGKLIDNRAQKSLSPAKHS